MRFSDFDALTFDCYGTLIDWEGGILAALSKFRTRHGVDAGDDELIAAYARAEADAQSGPFMCYRDVLRAVMGRLAAHYRVENADEDAIADSLQHWQPFPDSVSSLKRLAVRFRLAVVSNVDDDLFEHSARKLEVPFDRVITAQQVGAYKPSHRNFHRALETLGLPAERVLHVAQSRRHDIVPANQLGIRCVWVNRAGGRIGVDPAQGAPDLEVPDLATLAALVEEGSA